MRDMCVYIYIFYIKFINCAAHKICGRLNFEIWNEDLLVLLMDFNLQL